MGSLFFLCGLEAIPRWQVELAKLEGFKNGAKFRMILIPGVRNLAIFVSVFLIVDGVAAFSGAYTLLGGSGGMLDAGLLLVTYVCLLYTSPSPRDLSTSRMPASG